MGVGMADITQSDLNKLIEQHEKWLNNNEIGKRPNFSGMDLSYLELKRANLYHSIFEGSNLTGCNFRYTNLDKADLKKANLTKANLKETNLFRANLHQALLKDVKVNEESLFVGDGGSDELHGAKKAGMKTVFTEYLVQKSENEREQILADTDYHINKFEKILDIISSIKGTL